IPIVTSTGDVLSELVEREGLGATVEPGDVDGWVEALSDLCDPGRRQAVRRELDRVAPQLEWPSVVESLEAMIVATKRTGGSLPARSTAAAGYAARRLLSRLASSRFPE